MSSEYLRNFYPLSYEDQNYVKFQQNYNKRNKERKYQHYNVLSLNQELCIDFEFIWMNKQQNNNSKEQSNGFIGFPVAVNIFSRYVFAEPDKSTSSSL